MANNNRQIKSHSRKAGMPPGTLIHTGEKKVETVRITLIDYDEKGLRERVVEKVDDSFPFKDSPSVTWLNIDGLHDVEIIEKVGSNLEIHPLVLEDILNTGQRPKFEDHEKSLYIVMKMLKYNEEDNTVRSEQVSVVLGQNYVVSFQEEQGDVFEQIRERLRNSKGRIRKMSADYLTYALMDAVVDNYFLILEKMGEQIESLDEELIAEPPETTVRSIHALKRELISLRKSVWPLRELIMSMDKTESPFISKATSLYLRDVYDHTIQIIDTIENFREMAASMLDIYLSSISNRMNAVMKVLTMIATIFIPLTFIAGVYGMNFKYMPELEWKWAYPCVWLVMVLVAIVMVIFFKRKKWF